MNIRSKDTKIEKLTYTLPENKIAKYPLNNRDYSKLLVFENNSIRETIFRNIDQEFRDNDLLIFNNTKVIQARLLFRKESGAQIEVFCLEPYLPKEYNLAFQAKKICRWKCLVGNSKKWKSGKISLFNDNILLMNAERLNEETNEESLIEFSWNNELAFSEILELAGKTPIPPYLNRKAEDSDKNKYQTIYSKFEGSVAAPTSGLHFTNHVFEKLKNKNVKLAEITLHVGAGTFKPIKVENAANHLMHAETFFVNRNLIEQIATHTGRIVAIGTTTLRTLESIFYLGYLAYSGTLKATNHFQINQWDIYQINQNITRKESFLALLNYLNLNETDTIFAQTQIMITPEYQIKCIDGLITNFHQPESTLLLLVASWTGDKWKNIYNYALENNYRFLSYGDSSLLWKNNE